MLPILAPEDTCTGCLACVDSCNYRAITVGYNAEGFLSPSISAHTCTGCGNCEKICPVINGYSYQRTDNLLPTPYAAWSENDELRMKSASGGAFSELAKTILAAEGIVIGAVIDGLYVKHIAIDTMEDLHLLQGSKYMQSNTEGIYKKTYQYLRREKTVLFSGTPCQVGGLQSFLQNKDYPGKLYCVDVACRGIPSRLILDAYNKHIGNKLKEIISFRKKDESWLSSVRPQHCVIVAENNQPTDAGSFYMNAFLNDLALRQSCYDCKFAYFERKSDLTLADFWFVKEHTEQHRKGVSLLITNTPQGESLLKSSHLNSHKTTWGRTNIWYNSRIFRGINTVNRHPIRSLMPLLMKTSPIDDLNRIFALQNCTEPLWQTYKEQHKQYIYNDYLQNKQAYFKLMLEKGTFVNIVSFQMAYNYGSVLQSYALKQVVERLGYDVRHINLKPNSVEKAFDWNYGGAQQLRQSFNEFRKTHFPHSLNLYDHNQMSLKFNNFDIFIAGSDQIWNPVYSDRYYREFFLNFVPDTNKKIAYAASFGAKSTIENLHDEIQKYLLRFDAVSCREEEAVELCKDYFNIEACQVLDPTLLDIDYSQLFHPEKFQPSSPELVFFGLGEDRVKQYDWLKYIAKEQNLNAKVINGTPTDKDMLYAHYVSVEEWLSLLYNSSMIVTNSYHAFLFAIIFRKPFMIVPRHVGKSNETMEFSRFESLLSDLGLENRYFASLEEIKADHRWKDSIDYSSVYAKLEQLKKLSVTFLEKALKNK